MFKFMPFAVIVSFIVTLILTSYFSKISSLNNITQSISCSSLNVDLFSFSRLERNDEDFQGTKKSGTPFIENVGE